MTASLARGRGMLAIGATALAIAMSAGCGGVTSAAATHRSAASIFQTGGHATIGALSITGAYIPDPATPTIAAAYFTVTNSGAADRLLSIQAKNFDEAMLNKYVTTGDGGQRMVPVGGGAIVPADSTLVLMPDSYHLMLMRPHQNLRRGMTEVLTLHFAHAGVVTLRVPVVSDLGLPGSGQTTMPNMPGMQMSSGSS